jgi:segregation and condensation protein B
VSRKRKVGKRAARAASGDVASQARVEAVPRSRGAEPATGPAAGGGAGDPGGAEVAELPVLGMGGAGIEAALDLTLGVASEAPGEVQPDPGSVAAEVLAEGSGPIAASEDLAAATVAAHAAIALEPPAAELAAAASALLDGAARDPGGAAAGPSADGADGLAVTEARRGRDGHGGGDGPHGDGDGGDEPGAVDGDGAAGSDEEGEPGAVLPTSAASMDAEQLKHLVEALVFASDKPLTIARLRQLTRVSDTRRLEQALAQLAADFSARGLVLQQVSGGYQFRTRTQLAPWVQQLIAGRPVRLSRAQLETLAIIAYRQPITRPEIDDIRGVDSSATLKLLIDRALIRILGKREEVGRPMLYGTTKEFLDFFSLGDLRELPTLREYSELTDESRRVMSDRLGVGLDGAPPAIAGDEGGASDDPLDDPRAADADGDRGGALPEDPSRPAADRGPLGLGALFGDADGSGEGDLEEAISEALPTYDREDDAATLAATDAARLEREALDVLAATVASDAFAADGEELGARSGAASALVERGADPEPEPLAAGADVGEAGLAPGPGEPEPLAAGADVGEAGLAPGPGEPAEGAAAGADVGEAGLAPGPGEPAEGAAGAAAGAAADDAGGDAQPAERAWPAGSGPVADPRAAAEAAPWVAPREEVVGEVDGTDPLLLANGRVERTALEPETE